MKLKRTGKLLALLLAAVMVFGLLPVTAAADGGISVALSGDYEGVTFYYGPGVYTKEISTFPEVDLATQALTIPGNTTTSLKMVGDLTSLTKIKIGSHVIDIDEFCTTYSVDLSEESWDDFAQVHINATSDPTTAAEMGITSGDLWYGYIGDEGWTSCFVIYFEEVTINSDFSLSLTFKGDEPSTVDVTSVTLDKATESVEVGETVTLAATVLPENATDPTVTWTSSDESVATVADGVVTGISAGTATITAAAGEQSATCEVTVTEPTPAGIMVSLSGNYEGVEFHYGPGIYSRDLATFPSVDLTSQPLTILSDQSCTLKMVGDLESLVSIQIGEYYIDFREFCSTYNIDLTELPFFNDWTQVAVVTADDPTTAAEMGMTAGSLGYGYILDEGFNNCFVISFESVTVNDDFSLSLVFKSDEPTVDVTSITLDQESASVVVGETVTLAATVLPENATDPTVTWTSSEKTAGTVLTVSTERTEESSHCLRMPSLGVAKRRRGSE